MRDGLPDPHSDVLLSEVDGRLRVHAVPAPGGNPSRWRRPPTVRLAHGEWLRWRINYRFSNSCDGDWTYRQDTLNIVYGRPRPTSSSAPPYISSTNSPTCAERHASTEGPR
ncbi:hypothetical protein [Actinomadura sp. HBU206391]|uniref:hypothetical protein n=1 Tax=Actinomadura sp. HBU206391 TaxID=2731692 RepID=UPI001C9BD782|nr:hypothetical protein [Actinomadura sp. HBU206391]